MKTKEQILKWLNEQPWKNEFYEEAFFDRGFSVIYDEYFICGAFDWSATKSGAGIWKQRDIVFRQWYDSNDKPTSWEEYCEQNPVKDGIHHYIDIIPLLGRGGDASADIHAMSKDLCEAFLAYMKLIQLRNAWVKDCENGNENEYRKIVYTENLGFHGVRLGKTGLSFPTLAMADEFIETFRDLLDVAKPLI